MVTIVVFAQIELHVRKLVQRQGAVTKDRAAKCYRRDVTVAA
jgi:hypothetical protein